MTDAVTLTLTLTMEEARAILVRLEELRREEADRTRRLTDAHLATGSGE